MQRAEMYEEQRQAYIKANNLPEDWQPDPEDVGPWWECCDDDWPKY